MKLIATPGTKCGFCNYLSNVLESQAKFLYNKLINN